jgi:hypothetical protein
MRAGLAVPAVVAAVAVLGSGCVTGRELRVQAELHAPVIPQHEERKLEPDVGLMLVNPLVCFQPSSGCSGGGEGAGLCALVLIACAGVLGAVDLVALPVQAVRRHGQVRDLEQIGLTCPLDDPASRAASGLADRMVQEFGFAPASPGGAPGTLSEPVEGKAPAPVLLRVSTTRFERSYRIEWSARIDFVHAGGKVLWRRECGESAPAREARTFVEECETAREELATLADRCVDVVAGDLRRRWPEWDPARKPPREAATP